MSAFDCVQASQTVGALDKVVAQIVPQVDTQWPGLSRSIFFAETYGPSGRGEIHQGTRAFATVDLLDTLQRMRKQVAQLPGQAEYAALVEQVTQKCLLATYAGRAHHLSQGLAVYAPLRADMYNKEYAKVRLAQESQWPALIQKIHQVQKAKLTPPQVTGVRFLERDGQETDTIKVAGTQQVEITVEGENILWTIAEITQRVENPRGWAVFDRAFLPDMDFAQRKQKQAEEAAALIDVVMPQYVDGKNVLKMPTAGLTFLLTNGREACGATIDNTESPNLRDCNVKVYYEHPSVGAVLAQLKVDLNLMVVTQVTGFKIAADGSTIPFPITPQSDAVITTYYVVNTDDGKVDFLPTGQLEVAQGTLPHPRDPAGGPVRPGRVGRIHRGLVGQADRPLPSPGQRHVGPVAAGCREVHRRGPCGHVGTAKFPAAAGQEGLHFHSHRDNLEDHRRR